MQLASALPMEKVWVTSRAGDQNGKSGVPEAIEDWPGWEAVTEQLPEPRIVRVLPLTLQAPDALTKPNVTGKPDVEVALSVIGASPYFGAPTESKEITCLTL